MKTLPRFAAIAVALAIGSAIVFELVLRAFWPELFPRHAAGLHQPHPVIGHVLVPGREHVLVRPEYTVTARVNRDGFRGAELLAGRPDFRVVCLGDWATWGEGVDDAETYPSRLQSMLRADHPDLTIEVVNAGIPQYATIEELAWWKTFAATLAPDLVIAQFYTGDDFEQNDVPAGERYEFRDDELHNRDSYTAAVKSVWMAQIGEWKHRSHAFHWLSERAGNRLLRAGLLSQVERSSGDYFRPDQAERAQSLLREIDAVADGVGAETLFLVVPEKMQVIGSRQSSLRAAQIVAAVARGTEAIFVDLTPMLRDPALWEDVYYDTVGTWKPAGYEIAAEALHRAIGAAGLVEAASARRRPASAAGEATR